MATKTNVATDYEAAVRRLADEAWNNGNLAIVDELVDPNVEVHDPAMPEEMRGGAEGVKQVVSMYRSAFPDVRFEIEDVIAQEDKVAFRWRSEGTHRGELMGLAPTGKRGSVTGITIDRFADGKLVETWVHWDNLGLMQQVGAAPARGSRGEWLGIQVQRLSVKAQETATRLREKRSGAAS